MRKKVKRQRRRGRRARQKQTYNHGYSNNDIREGNATAEMMLIKNSNGNKTVLQQTNESQIA